MRTSVISNVPAKLLPSIIFWSRICLEHILLLLHLYPPVKKCISLHWTPGGLSNIQTPVTYISGNKALYWNTASESEGWLKGKFNPKHLWISELLPETLDHEFEHPSCLKGAMYKINSLLVAPVQYQLYTKTNLCVSHTSPFPGTPPVPPPVLSNSAQWRHVLFGRNFRLWPTTNLSWLKAIHNQVKGIIQCDG